MIRKVILGLLITGQSFAVFGEKSEKVSNQASSSSNSYYGIDASYLRNSVGSNAEGEAKFSLGAAGFRFGHYLEPQVGIEVFASLGVNDDEDIGIDMSVKSTAGILGRFETPETEDGLKYFVLLGYGMAELELQRSTASLPDRELYHGFVYGGGAEVRLGGSNSYINIQGLRHYDEKDLSLDGISLGFRQGF